MRGQKAHVLVLVAELQLRDFPDDEGTEESVMVPARALNWIVR
jgi:hypothetical protein